MREEVLRTKENDNKSSERVPEAATSESIGARFMVLVESESEEDRRGACDCEQ